MSCLVGGNASDMVLEGELEDRDLHTLALDMSRYGLEDWGT